MHVYRHKGRKNARTKNISLKRYTCTKTHTYVDTLIVLVNKQLTFSFLFDFSKYDDVAFYFLTFSGEELGQPNYAVPFLAPNATGKAILYGVNYASGGGGILNATGRIFVSTENFPILFRN